MIEFDKAVAVARQDLLDVRRARLVQGVVALYVLFVTLVFAGISLGPDPSVAGAIQITQGVVVLFVPLVALVATYLAVAGERESGTIRFLLGYPVSRTEVVLGKGLSRLGLVVLSILLGFLVGTVVVLVEYPDPDLAVLWGFAALTLVFAASYVGLALGVSAATSSRSRSMTAVIAIYFLFTVLWSAIPAVIQFATTYLFEIQLEGTIWQLFSHVGPPNAFGVTLALLPGEFAAMAPPIAPEYGLAILLAWAVLPLLLGHWAFGVADVE